VRVLVVHDRYDDAIPNGENAMVQWETAALAAHGVPVSVVETPASTLGEPLARRGLRHLGGVYSASSRRRVRQAIDDFRPDIAHVHNLWPHLTASIYFACRDARVPIVQTLHNYRMLCIADFLCRDGRPCMRCIDKTFAWPGVLHRCVGNSIGMSVVKMTAVGIHNALGTSARMVDSFIAPSESMRARFIHAGIPGDKLHVKPSCCPDFGMSDRPREHFCFAGRLSGEKGVDLLLRLWASRNAPELVIAGAGPLAGDVQRAAAANPAIRYAGMLSREGVSALMGSAIATLVPSIWEEPSPVVTMQSFSVGTPVIASASGGGAQTVAHEQTGLVFPTGDLDALGQCVDRALAHPDQCRRMGKAARREYDERYSVERSHARLMQIYAGTLDRHAR